MAATDDPRATIQGIVDTYIAIAANKIKKDDGATDAAVLTIWESGPTTLKTHFATYDVVITFGSPSSRSVRPIQDVPVHYNMRYPITVSTVNKPLTGIGHLVCSGPIMQYHTLLALRAAIQASAQSVAAATPAYTIRIMDDAAKHSRIGGLDVWQATHYVQYETDYP